MVRVGADTWRHLTGRQRGGLDGWLAHHGQPTSLDNVVKEVIFGDRTAIVTIYKLAADGRPYVIGDELAVRYQSLPLPVSGLAAEIEEAFGKRAAGVIGETGPEMIQVRVAGRVIPESEIESLSIRYRRSGASDTCPPGETRAAIGVLVAQAAEGCCMDDAWRGQQCQYHQGYEDGLWAGVERLPEVGP